MKNSNSSISFTLNSSGPDLFLRLSLFIISWMSNSEIVSQTKELRIEGGRKLRKLSVELERLRY